MDAVELIELVVQSQGSSSSTQARRCRNHRRSWQGSRGAVALVQERSSEAYALVKGLRLPSESTQRRGASNGLFL